MIKRATLVVVLFLLASCKSDQENDEDEAAVVLPPTPTEDGEHHHHHPHDDIHQHHHHPHPVQVNNDNEHHKQLYAQNHAAHQQPSTTSRVLELSDRFLEIVNTVMTSGGAASQQIGPDSSPKYQPWLVMFYAPWCGHCKRLEPQFAHVAQALHNTPIRVGRVDCTRFPSVGQEFKIHGYPTIMFISGPTRRSTFQGDREVHQIVKFAKRMHEPPVTKPPQPLNVFLRESQSTSDLPPIQDVQNPARPKRESDHPTSAPPDRSHFFGLLRPSGYTDQLTDAFMLVASKYQQWNEFFEFAHDSAVTVFVFKHGRVLIFSGEDSVAEEGQQQQQNITEALERWVGRERHLDFMHLTRGNLYHVFSEGKQYVVAGVVNEDKLERVVNESQRRLLSTLKQVATSSIQQTLEQDNKFADQVSAPVSTTPLPHHFAWIGSPDLANSLVASHLTLPTLLIIEKSLPDHDHKYYVFSDPVEFDSSSKIENLVDLVMVNHFTPTVHANSWSFKAYRYLFDARTSLSDMWSGNPVLTVVLFGLPLGFLSLILYSVCCGDIMDAKEEDEDELDYESDHEKRE